MKPREEIELLMITKQRSKEVLQEAWKVAKDLEEEVLIDEEFEKVRTEINILKWVLGEI